MQDHLYVIGIMTGNSLDGADLVWTRFGRDGSIADLHAHSVPFPEDLKADLRAIRAAINAAAGRVKLAIAILGPDTFERTLVHYTDLLAGAVADLRAQAKSESVDLIGLHGQTCAHRPPSIAGTGATYTVQLGDGPALAKLTGVTVVNDFRSDDLMAGGEGAPLAPVHHLHLARGLGLVAIAFANAGNTGNISLVSRDRTSCEPRLLGWDTGPFNHFPDQLLQREAGQACDWNGDVGRRGAIHAGLLTLLFRSSVKTGPGDNFLLRPPPKSSDPEWYRLLPELGGTAPVDGQTLPFEDRVRTATYFATYALAHSLSLIPTAIELPTHFALAGGGWRNPLCLDDCRALLAGDPAAPILPEHEGSFRQLRTWTTQAVIEPSATLGIDPTAMEARIFADAAVARIKGEPFTLPSTTGVRQPTVCGLIHFPAGDRSHATEPLQSWIDHCGTPTNPPTPCDPRWSRASAGWREQMVPR